jgi:hypothetical protein
MLSPVSSRHGSNLVQPMANRVQPALGDVKSTGMQQLGGPTPESLLQTLAQLQQLLEQLVGMLGRAGGVPPGAEPGSSSISPAGKSGGGMYGQDSFSPGGAPAAPAGLPSLDGVGSSELLAGIQVSDPRLRQALELIATHPDGARLIAAAKANGLTSISHNPSLNPDGGAGTEGLAIYGGGNARIEIANPNSPNLIHTLAHELGHAATTGDGNSQLEERTVDALGERIHRDLLGQASTFNLDLGSYSHLSFDNGILNSLRGLGIRV